MSKILAWISISVGGFATLIALVFASRFFFVAGGVHIRPMGWVMLIAVPAGLAFVVGVPTGICALFTPRRKMAVIGLALSLAPYPLSIVIVNIASAICGFTVTK